MTRDDQPAVDRLLRGISTDHVETVRDAWRDILRNGASSVPQVQAKLKSSAWSDYPRGPLAKYFGVLLSILDALDPTAFEAEVLRLGKSKLHPFHAKTLHILSQRIRDEPATHVWGGVPVFVSADISDRSIVVKNIERWSKTKGLPLNRLTRIDVIAHSPAHGYLGLYNLFFSGIVLTWPAAPVRGFRLWRQRFEAEHTFYHEVGHHVLGHVEGGQVAEQEMEADDFAASMLRNSRPVLTFVGKVLLWAFRPLIKRIVTPHLEKRYRIRDTDSA